MPTTSSPFCLDLNEGRIGHRIELGSEVETTTLFRTALGVNFGGVVPTLSIKQVVGALSSIGNQRFNMVVCAKQVLTGWESLVTYRECEWGCSLFAYDVPT